MTINKIKSGTYKIDSCEIKIDNEKNYTVLNISNKFNFFFHKTGEFAGTNTNHKNRKNEIL